ncbi:hypothetical protein FRACA_240023 [Frankia canadensis]|uniref:Uncharacterized protein n=1 Tax=Frankia canadensis TaxID=1836972 RepID=A0A2I2KRS5_9ACTN|nr:hypothetical protein FRACA_240023 [Frankia canadensis]SOU55639.1 hypothetical protein FRACA_240023 [Frankia canadensis]
MDQRWLRVRACLIHVCGPAGAGRVSLAARARGYCRAGRLSGLSRVVLLTFRIATDYVVPLMRPACRFLTMILTESFAVIPADGRHHATVRGSWAAARLRRRARDRDKRQEDGDPAGGAADSSQPGRLAQSGDGGAVGGGPAAPRDGIGARVRLESPKASLMARWRR